MTPMVENPTAVPLAMIFALNDGLMVRALDGVKDEDLWRRPSSHANALLWLVAHLVHTRAGMLRLLGDEYRTGWGELFRRGAPVVDVSQYPPRSDIDRVRDEVGRMVQMKVRALDADRLAQPASGIELPLAKTVADQIAFFCMHDSYHVGQISYARKLLGYAGIAG